jgi:hypothetical protein
VLAYWLHQIAAHFYPMWAVVGPLVGVVIGAWLTARWQRKKWILDNKTSEYRSILDALNSYRFVLTEYYALYKVAMVAVPAQKMYEGEASALLHLLDKAFKPGMVGFGDGSMESLVPDLRTSLREILPQLSYGAAGDDEVPPVVPTR